MYNHGDEGGFGIYQGTMRQVYFIDTSSYNKAAAAATTKTLATARELAEEVNKEVVHLGQFLLQVVSSATAASGPQRSS